MLFVFLSEHNLALDLLNQGEGEEGEEEEGETGCSFR